MRASRILPILVGLLMLACTAEPPRPRVVIETEAGRVMFRVELAETDEARSRGLMGRERLAVDAGMVFLWPSDTETAFHMRETLIPLSVAFFDADGRIVRMIDLEPCRADPCPAYAPGGPYRGALEVNAGELARRGVRIGDHLRVER